MTPPADKRVEYGTGSVYQRKSDGLWIAVIENATEHGYTDTGRRKRITVSGKTPAQAKLRRKNRIRELERSQGATGRATVKTWADEYLKLLVREVSPKGFNAAASPIRKWVVPTIGGKRLDQLTSRDIRAVHDACRKAGRQPADVHRVMHAMLARAVAEEGHYIQPRTLAVKAPTPPKSDRKAMTEAEGIRLLQAAAEIPRGSRWIFTILYGARMGECLGLTRDALDLDAAPLGEAIIEWQLQPIPYRHGCNDDGEPTCGKKRAASCPERAFRVPDGHESQHLVDAYHLVRPKSRAGYRVAPFLTVVRKAILHALEHAAPNPWGLIWPDAHGRPMNDKHDRAEWWALQEAAGIHHPTRTRKVDGKTVPGYYHVHETRNFAATMLLDAGVPEHVVVDLLGHSTVAQSLKYRTKRREPLMEAMERVGERLQLG